MPKKGEKVKFRMGPLMPAEKKVLDASVGRVSAEELAKQLNRHLKTVTNYLDKKAGVTQSARESIQAELMRRPDWKKFQAQFSDEELGQFKYRYVQLVEQFGRDDVLHTEVLQIYDVIKLEILADRHLEAQRDAMIQAADLKDAIDVMKEKVSHIKNPKSPEAVKLFDQLAELQSDLAEAKDTTASSGDKYKMFVDMSTKMWKDLKGTRDQRVKNLDGPQNSFLGIIKSMADAEFREQEGSKVALMQLATAKELGRLQAPHKFSDGMIDCPVLTPEGVLADEEEEVS